MENPEQIRANKETGILENKLQAMNVRHQLKQKRMLAQLAQLETQTEAVGY